MAQEVWLVEKTYKCTLKDAINSDEDIVSIHEVEENFCVLNTRLKNSFQIYPKGFEIDWGEFPQSDVFKIRDPVSFNNNLFIK